VLVANTGEEALKIFSESRVDVVVTDYRMPGTNGAQLIGAFRTIEPNARVILISGFVEPLGLTEANTGADVVIVKSSSEAAHLVRSVKRLMNRPARKSPGMQKNPQRMARAATV